MPLFNLVNRGGYALPKSQIIKAIVDDEVSLAQSLRRLQVIAHDVKNDELEKWAESELTGYANDDDIPDYRCTESINFIYTGFNNYVHRVTNVPLNPMLLGEDVLDEVASVKFTQGISTLEEYACSSDASIKLDRSLLAGKVEQNSEGAIQCITIGQVIPKGFFQNVIAEVRNRVLKSLLRLEDEYGNLDDLGIDVSHQTEKDIERINHEINNDVLHIHVEGPESLSEPIGSKIAWKIIVPIVVAVIAGLIVALVVFFAGL